MKNEEIELPKHPSINFDLIIRQTAVQARREVLMEMPIGMMDEIRWYTIRGKNFIDLDELIKWRDKQLSDLTKERVRKGKV